MAIRTSKTDQLHILDNSNNINIDFLEKILVKLNFKNIICYKKLNQIKAEYKTFKTIGTLNISIHFNHNPLIKCLVLKSSANSDNIFALFKNPNDTILDLFKLELDKNI
jgi:glutamate formiminotransferase